jgi:uracil-DNA glycosylase family 4
VEDAAQALGEITAEIVDCRKCPRLVAWREQVAREKRAAYRDWEYWGRPVPGFGDASAGLMVVGLAPAAHGGNRTGRIFTGDESGNWLYRALYRAGFANQPASFSRDDGLRLSGAFVTASVRCAPPANKPAIDERENCLPYLRREIEALAPRVFLCLGSYAYDCVTRLLSLRPRPAFGHGCEAALAGGRFVLCSFHPSQQNTFTKKLTEPMFDAVFQRARQLLEAAPGP